MSKKWRDGGQLSDLTKTTLFKWLYISQNQEYEI
jgi:hypothetical protein